MITHYVVPLLLALALSSPKAQRQIPLTPGASGCQADSVDCLFGSSNACSVTCPRGSDPHCCEAYCEFGFPVNPTCRCLPPRRP